MGREDRVLLYIIPALILICYCDGLSTLTHNGDSLSLGTSLVENQTIISKNGTFELGFFSPNGSNNWYVGIWYASNIAEKMVVWVANRESPAKNKPGILNFSQEGILGLFDADHHGSSLWSVNISANKSSRAVLFDSGNFIILSDDNKSETLWQSFDHPVDTLLPGMWSGGQRKLYCWKNSMDPAPGLVSAHLDPSGAPQFVLTWNNSVQFWESGNFTGKTFSKIPEGRSDRFNVSVERRSSGFYFRYELLTGTPHFLQIKNGGFQGYSLFDHDSKWTMVLMIPRDQCAAYGFCGPYGSCNSNNLDFCSCLEGFTPQDKRAKNSQDWSSSGCVRQRPLNCDSEKGISGDEFMEPGVTLPDESASSYAALTKTDCQEACLHNCSCTAFSFDSPSGTCKIWSGDLLNMKNSPSNRVGNVSIRIAASAHPNNKKLSSSKLKIIVIVSTLSLAFSIFSFFMWQKYRLRPVKETSEDTSESFLRMFSYMELKIATRNFRSKLGSGGFGSVFKGALTDGTLVAVKRLECSSRHDEKQFRAEISSLGNIQHSNLIRLLGFCAQGSKRLLVYDYMPNGSLNSVLFTRDSRGRNGKVLDWKTRFEIALGTARGLLYLHDKCRNRIIHGDIKPENILLDANFSAKIADFGLAKVLGRDFSRVLTTLRGTRGYLAPEWISGVPITSKVDVYSFGITLLEIISGRRSLDFKVQDSSQYYFPPWAATQIYQGKIANIVAGEGVAMEGGDIEEVRRVGIVGLLCIEREEEMRPSMKEVVRMLEGKMELQTSQMLTSLVNERRADQSHSDSDIVY